MIAAPRLLLGACVSTRHDERAARPRRQAAPSSDGHSRGTPRGTLHRAARAPRVVEACGTRPRSTTGPDPRPTSKAYALRMLVIRPAPDMCTPTAATRSRFRAWAPSTQSRVARSSSTASYKPGAYGKAGYMNLEDLVAAMSVTTLCRWARTLSSLPRSTTTLRWRIGTLLML